MALLDKQQAKDILKSAKEKTSEMFFTAKTKSSELIDDLKQQEQNIRNIGFSEKAIETTKTLIIKLADIPVVRVNRDDFLKQLFGNTKDEFDVTIMRYTEEYDEKCADYVSKTYNFMEDGKLSERSLLGRSIVGTKVGECCKYKAPDGKQVVVRVLSLKKDRAGIC